MSAQMLEVSLLGVGTVLGLERDAWSMVNLLRQATNEYAPPSAPIPVPYSPVDAAQCLDRQNRQDRRASREAPGQGQLCRTTYARIVIF